MNKKKLPRIGLGKWVLVAAFIAGFNLLVASVHAIPTTLNSVLPAVANGQPAVLAWFTGTTAFPTPLGISHANLGNKDDSKDKDKDSDKDAKDNNGKDDNDGDDDSYVGTPATVPDGGKTLVLLGAALLGLAVAGRKFKGTTSITH